MSYSASDIFDAIAPDYASDSRKTLFLDLSTNKTSSVFFGSRYNEAIALRAAHMITLADRKGNGGTVTSQREGDLAVSFSSVNVKNNSGLNLTSYGMELLQLIRETQAGVSVGGIQTMPTNNN